MKPAHKGIDDAMANGVATCVLNGEAATAVIDEIEAEALEADPPLTATHRFKIGERVIAGDRGNQGEIVQQLPGLRYSVHFVGPDGEATVPFLESSLQPLSGPGPGKTPPGRPRTVSPYRPFPVNAIPEPIAEYVRQASRALGCDPAFEALPVLSVLASAIGNTRTIRLKGGWDEPSVIWTAVVADSGTLKTPAYVKATRHLNRIQGKLFDEHSVRMTQYEAEKRVYEKAKKASQSARGDPPEKPSQKRLICSDITIEKLAEILQQNPRGILLGRDELAAWLASFSRYKASGGSDLPNWLEMHNARTIIVDRKLSETTLYVPRAAVCITGGIQPGVLAKALTAEFLDAGLAARLLMSMPPRLPKVWTDAEVSQQSEEAYKTTIEKLLQLDFDNEENERHAPHILLLSRAGREAWIAFHDEWGRELANVEGEVASAFSKLEAYAARFALLHHVVSHVTAGRQDYAHYVGPESIEAGATLCRWFAHEACRVYETLTEKEEDRNARRLVEFIQARGGRVTAAVIQRSNKKKYPTSDASTAALEALVQAGMGVWEDRPPSAVGGRPTRDFVLQMASEEAEEQTDEGDRPACTPCYETSDETPSPESSVPAFKANGEVSSVSSQALEESSHTTTEVWEE